MTTTPTVTTPVLLTRALATIVEVWADTLDPPKVSTGGGGGGGKPASRSPLPDGAFEARRTAAGVLASWCVLVGEERGVCPVRLGQDVVVDMAHWLSGHVEWLAGEEFGPVAALELEECARDLDRLAHPDRPDALFIGRCPVEFVPGGPACGRRLYWPPAALTMECPSCGIRDDVKGWVQRMGDDLPDELTAVQLSTYLTRKLDREVSHDLIRKWVSRGVLNALPHRDGRGRPLYPAAAALVLAEAHVERSQRPPRRLAS